MLMNPTLLSRWLALCAGSADLLSGLGFILLPALTLRIMGLVVPGSEALVFVRFVGVYVALVGLSYLWALLDQQSRLRVVFEVTLLFRLGTGLFTGVAVVIGQLPAGWLLVTAADFALVAAQGWLLTKGLGHGL